MCLYTLDVTERVQKFIASVSSVLRYKRSGQIFATILISKYLSILFYGLDGLLCFECRCHKHNY
jgi:hypothetical protein